MSLVWRLLAVMALGTLPMMFGLAAAANPSAPGNASSGTQGGHKGAAKAGTGPARATEIPGPGGQLSTDRSANGDVASSSRQGLDKVLRFATTACAACEVCYLAFMMARVAP